MTPDHRQALNARRMQIERELADLLNGQATLDIDPSTREVELLEEQDAIEFELAADKLQCGFDASWRDDI